MSYLTLTPENLADQHICCGFADKKIAAGYQAKKELLAARFAEGFRFRKSVPKKSVSPAGRRRSRHPRRLQFFRYIYMGSF